MKNFPSSMLSGLSADEAKQVTFYRGNYNNLRNIGREFMEDA